MKTFLHSITAVLFILLFSNCSVFIPEEKNDNNLILGLVAAAATAPQPFSLQFEGRNGLTPITSFGATDITINGTATRFRDFRFYVSEVKFLRADGTKVSATINTDDVWQSRNIALVDLDTVETANTNDKVTGSVAPGTYTGIEFTLGIPENTNHLQISTLASPLNVTSMYWAWSSGFKFVSVEFSLNNGANYTQFHLGSQACKNVASSSEFGECAMPFRPTISLTGNVKLMNQKVAVNAAALLNGFTNTADNFCMPLGAGTICNTLVQSVGLRGRASGTGALDVSNISAGTGSMDPTITQTVFSLTE